jgi:hypothetical protein
MTRRYWINLPLLLLVAAAALVYGIKLRRQLYESAEPIRFTLDLNNAYWWGKNARSVGLVYLYHAVAVEHQRFSASVQLDYTPLRLAAVTAWQMYIEKHYPGITRIQPDFEFAAPMLWGNTIAALIASVFVFLNIRLWRIRYDQRLTPSGEGVELRARRDLRYSEDPDPPAHQVSTKRDPLRGAWAAMAGALLLWFNPALLWNGYVWPQWDAWLIPFAVAAIYFASIDAWFVAGVCLAVGASLKGQLLMAAPIFVLWPLFQLRFGAILRLLAGFALISAWAIFPFLLTGRAGIVWYMLLIAALCLMAPYLLRWRLPGWLLLSLAAAAALMSWPWTSAAPLGVRLLAPGMLGLMALARHLPLRLIPHALALASAAAVFLLMPMYAASTAWYTQGFEYGPNRERMLHNVKVNNVPAMLDRYLHWQNSADQRVAAPLLGDVSAQTALGAAYAVVLVLCGAGAALQQRRRDPRFLIAMFLPWLCFFLLLTQMRGRYLVWAAAMSALLAGVSPGMTLLGLLITAISLIQMIGNQFQLNAEHRIAGAGANALSQNFQAIQPYLTNLDPHLGWMLLLIAAVGVYQVLTIRDRSSAPQ